MVSQTSYITFLRMALKLTILLVKDLKYLHSFKCKVIVKFGVFLYQNCHLLILKDHTIV